MLATTRLLKAAPPPLRRSITTAQLDIVRDTLPAVAAAGTKLGPFTSRERSRDVLLLLGVVWKSTSSSRSNGEQLASMAWNLHTIKQTQLRGRRRVASEFYFHTGGSKEFMASVAGQLASYGVPQSRLAFESFGPSEAGDVLAQAA